MFLTLGYWRNLKFVDMYFVILPKGWGISLLETILIYFPKDAVSF